MKRSLLLSVATTTGVLAFASIANAGSVRIDGLGGPVDMNSKAINGVFGANSPEFTEDALNAIHNDLASSGIVTDRLVTFLLAETDHGLSWVTLVDDNRVGEGAAVVDSQLSMSSTAPDTGVHFVNDIGGDITSYFNPPSSTQTAAGFFNWDSTRFGDAFAWAGLTPGDFVTFEFGEGGDEFSSFPGLSDEETFQFVSWTGEAWEVVATGAFSQADQFAFSFTVIPLPTPVLLGLGGLAIVGVTRRRMMKA